MPMQMSLDPWHATRNKAAGGDQVRYRASACPDYVDRDLHRRRRSSVLKPVCGVLILGPAHSRPILRGYSISMISDRSLQYVDHARPVLMVVNRAEDPFRFDRHHSHPKLPSCHALEFRAKVKPCYQLHRDTFRLRCRLFVSHRDVLSVRSGHLTDGG